MTHAFSLAGRGGMNLRFGTTIRVEMETRQKNKSSTGQAFLSLLYLLELDYNHDPSNP
jgi:hypothetical protein